MANRKVSISMDSKEILENLCGMLEVERPLAVKIALAKGIASYDKMHTLSHNGSGKWAVPDGIIRGNEFILYKHLMINELDKMLDEDETNKFLGLFIEKGLLVIKQELSEISSLQDYRITILDTAQKEAQRI
jgi:hypothetical protein